MIHFPSKFGPKSGNLVEIFSEAGQRPLRNTETDFIWIGVVAVVVTGSNTMIMPLKPDSFVYDLAVRVTSTSSPLITAAKM